MKRIVLIFILILSTSAALYAKGVSGTILDESGDPIIGASVIDQQTMRGDVTDINGLFKLEIADPESATLEVSYIGYQTKEVKLNGKTSIIISLEELNHELDEVIVVGYGAMKKSDLTGSIASISPDEKEAGRSVSFDSMLQGKAAGVVVTTGNSAPGGSVSISIRGTSSLRGNNQPLYVVDGNIMDTDSESDPMASGTSSGNSSMTTTNPLSSISPQDIASIEILKDASATAIYGSQGSNGVVLITTKQGKSETPTMTFSMSTTISNMSSEIPMLTTEEYADFYTAFTPNSPFSMEGKTAVNWQDYGTQTAISQNYRASVSGKSNKTNYYLAVGYTDDEGIIKNTSLTRYDMRLNLTQDINKRLKLKSTSLFSVLETSMTSGTDKLANSKTSIIRQMISFKPYISDSAMDYDDDYDEDLTGLDAWFADYDDDSKENSFNTTLSLDYKLLDYLKLQVKGGTVLRSKERKMWYGTQLFNGKACNGKAGISTLDSQSFNSEALFVFDKQLNSDHYLSATAGVVYKTSGVTTTSITGEDFSSQDLRADGISLANTLYPYSYSISNSALFSALSRLTYNFRDKYLLTATIRADGSSKFSEGNKFGYFPSFAAAWRIDQEPFLSSQNNISNLKLRAGWGQVGNQSISSYQTQSTYTTTQYATSSEGSVTGVTSTRIANPDLTWETSEQYNVGIDFGMFNQRLNVTVDGYIKDTKDLLQSMQIGTHTGYSSMWVNNGSIRNQGIELSISGTPIDTRDWSWSVGGNVAFLKGTITALNNTPSDFGMIKDVSGYYGDNLGNNTYTKFPANAYIEGYAVGVFMGYETDGIMQTEDYLAQADDSRLTILGSEIQPGDVLYVDQNGDGVVDDNDKVILGDPTPDFSFALTSNVTWRSFSLDIAFNGVYGNQIVNANLIDEMDVKNSNSNVRKSAFYDAWTEEDGGNINPRLGYDQVGVLTDRLIEDGSYLRLSSVTLSHNWDMRKRAKNIRSIALSLTATNIFTLTNYSGYNPDVATFTNDMSRMGVDLASYPSTKSYILGLVMTF